MPSIELKPCPFCGGEASINDDPTGNGGKPITRGRISLGRLWSVECDECGADAGYWQDEEIAVLNWNHRAERTCRIVKTWSDSDFVDGWRYRCSECMAFIPVNERDPETGDVISAANFCPNCGAKVVAE